MNYPTAKNQEEYTRLLSQQLEEIMLNKEIILKTASELSDKEAFKVAVLLMKEQGMLPQIIKAY